MAKRAFRKGVAAAIRQSQGESQAEPVTLPGCGVEVLLRRPPLQLWAATGRFPQRLLGMAIESVESSSAREEAMADAEAKLKPNDKFSLLKFMADVVKYSFVEPRLVDGATGDDELDPGDLPPDDFIFVFQWATRTLKDQQVGAGGLTVGAVETFRNGGQHQSSVDAGGNLSELPNTAAV